jgi:tetratricopeptide (TPR) repeat protein
MPASPLANAPETLSATASNHYALPVAPRLRPSRSVPRTWGVMSVRTRALACASLAIILVAAPSGGTAIAQRAELRAWCAGQFGVALRQRIDACTAVIDSGRFDGKSLSSALSDRGVAYLNVRNNDRALADFNEAIRIDPDNAKAFGGRGLAYQLRAQEGDTERALADWAKALQINPDDADTLEQRARVYMIQRDYDGMIGDYGALIRLDPDNDWAFQQRAYAYRGKGELERALADYAEAIRIDPKNAQALHGRGLVLRDKGDLDRAIDDFSAAIAIDPDHVAVGGLFRDRAAAYRAKGDAARAAADEAEAKRRGW